MLLMEKVVVRPWTAKIARRYGQRQSRFFQIDERGFDELERKPRAADVDRKRLADPGRRHECRSDRLVEDGRKRPREDTSDRGAVGTEYEGVRAHDATIARLEENNFTGAPALLLGHQR